MKTRTVRTSGWIAGALLALVPAGRAFAQTPTEVAARRGLLSQAEAASRAGNHDQALELAQRAGRISMTPSLRFFLATEQNALGHFAAALGNAELCTQTAERDTTLRNRAALITQCRQLTTDLQGHIGHITLRVPTPTPEGLQINVDGQSVSDAFWGVPFVVNPGHIVVEVQAAGHEASRHEIDVTAGGTMDVPVELGAEVVVASASPPPVEVASAPPVSTPPVNPPPPPSRGPGAAPWILAGGGVVAAVAGVVLVTVVRPAALRRLESDCLGVLVCADSNRGNYDLAVGSTVGGGIAIGVGVALIGGGLGWFLGSRTNEHRSAIRSMGAAPLAEGGAMFSLGGVM